MIFSFDVEYLSNNQPNELRIRGRGRLNVYEGGIELTGHDQSEDMAQREVKFLFHSDRICNVLRTDETVFFQIVPDDAGQEFLNCLVDAGNASRHLESLLPQNVTSDFKNKVLEIREFSEKLFAMTPGVHISSLLFKGMVLIFILMVITGADILRPGIEDLVRWGANAGYLTTSGQWWRMLTCVFIHIGLIHLVFNVWVLNAIGPLVERIYGNAVFLMIFIFSGLCGSLNSLYWNPAALSAGASGAIFGISGALLAYIAVFRKTIPIEIFSDLKRSYLSFVVFNLLFGAAIPGIDNAAHLGGLAGGFVMGFLTAVPLDAGARKSGRWSRLVKGTILLFFTLYLVIPIIPTYAAQFQQTMDWFADEEKNINEKFKSHIGNLRTQPSKGIVTADLIEKDCLQRWRDIEKRFSVIDLPDHGMLHEKRELILKFSRTQLKSFESLIFAIRYDDAGKLEEFVKSQEEAKKVIREMSGDL